MGPNALDLIFLEVDSLEESLDFYRDALGFELVAHQPDSEPPMATLRVGRLRLTLVQQAATMARRGRGVHFVFGVEDVGSFYERLRARELDVSEPADEGWGGRFISLVDPDRYRLFFVTWHDAEAAGGRRLTGSLDSLSLN